MGEQTERLVGYKARPCGLDTRPTSLFRPPTERDAIGAVVQACADGSTAAPGGPVLALHCKLIFEVMGRSDGHPQERTSCLNDARVVLEHPARPINQEG